MNRNKWLKAQKIMGWLLLFSVPVVSLGNLFLMLILIYLLTGTFVLSLVSLWSVRNATRYYDSKRENRPTLVQITVLILSLTMSVIFIVLAKQGITWDGQRVTNIYVDSFVAVYYLIFTSVAGRNLFLLITENKT
jgi:hypothetical protein